MTTRLGSVLAVVAVVAGCSTIRNARIAQEDVSAKGAGVTHEAEKVDFRGRSFSSRCS